MDKIIANGTTPGQFQADTRHQREKQIKKLLKRYEKTVFSFFRELSLPLKFREIIRAYILASGGETFFEASYNDLTDLLFKRNAIQLEANRQAVRYHARALQDWQERKKVELIRVIEPGRRITLSDGSYEYPKTKYQFVLLDELVKALYGYSDKELEVRIKAAVARMRQSYLPGEEKKQIPAYFMLQRNVKTVFTKFGKVFDKAEQVKLDPVGVCQKLISDLQAGLDAIVEQRTEKQNRERLISEFLRANDVSNTDASEERQAENIPESRVGNSDSVSGKFRCDSETEARNGSFSSISASINSHNTDTYEKVGVETHHINLQGNTDLNLPSDNRISTVFTDSQMDADINLDSTSLNFSVAVRESENPLLNAALQYVKAGYCVFPLQNLIFENGSVRCSCQDWENCEKQGKHPRTWHGLLDATTNPETINLWWRKWPKANVGLVTGKQSNIFVLDVDIKSGGEYSLGDLQDAYGSLPATLTAITGSGGRHLIFNYPKDVKLKNSTSLIAPGLDIKSDNGYIVAAPSRHFSGGRYEWHGANTPVLDAPDWLIALILIAEDEAKTDETVKSIPLTGNSYALASTEIIREGQEFDTGQRKKGRGRHDYLFRYACGLVMSHNPEQVLTRLQARNTARCVPALEYEDVAKLVQGAERYRDKQIKRAA